MARSAGCCCPWKGTVSGLTLAGFCEKSVRQSDRLSGNHVVPRHFVLESRVLTEVSFWRLFGFQCQSIVNQTILTLTFQLSGLRFVFLINHQKNLEGKRLRWCQKEPTLQTTVVSFSRPDHVLLPLDNALFFLDCLRHQETTPA